MFDDIASWVEELRGITPEDEAAVRFLSRDEFRESNAAEQDTTGSDEELLAQSAAAQRLLKAIGAIEPDVDLEAEAEEAFSEGVGGYYSFDTQELTLVAEITSADEVKPSEAYTYAHEYTHLLQDEEYDLEQLRNPDLEQQTLDAMVALTEGDAQFTAYLSILFYGGQEYLNEALLGETGEGAGEEEEDWTEEVSPFLVRSFLFPYVEGFEFVISLYQALGQTAPTTDEEVEANRQAWRDRLDEIYASPPVTSEHILHPDRYVEGDEPVAVPALDLLDTLGDGWTEIETGSNGEFFLVIWLEALEANPELIGEATTGWGGDSFALYGGPEGSASGAGRVQWDDPATDPEQFRSLMVETLDGLETFDRLETQDPAISVWAGPVDYLAIASAEAAPSEFLFATAPTAEQAEALVAELISSATAE